MHSERNDKAKTGYDPTESGVPDEMAKSHQADPSARDLSPEEKRRAEETLGRFEQGRSDQRST